MRNRFTASDFGVAPPAPTAIVEGVSAAERATLEAFARREAVRAVAFERRYGHAYLPTAPLIVRGDAAAPGPDHPRAGGSMRIEPDRVVDLDAIAPPEDDSDAARARHEAAVARAFAEATVVAEAPGAEAAALDAMRGRLLTSMRVAQAPAAPLELDGGLPVRAANPITWAERLGVKVEADPPPPTE